MDIIDMKIEKEQLHENIEIDQTQVTDEFSDADEELMSLAVDKIESELAKGIQVFNV